MKVIVNGNAVHVHWGYTTPEPIDGEPQAPLTTCKIVKARTSKEEPIEVLAEATVRKHDNDVHNVDKARKFALEAALEQLFPKMEVPAPIIKIVNQDDIDGARKYNKLVAKDRGPFWAAYFSRKPTFVEKILSRFRPKLRVEILAEIKNETINQIEN